MRNRSLDLLKMISMLLVIGLHFLYYGGFLEQYNTIKTNVLGYCFTWILEALCYFSVDVFILITGYFMCESQMKTTRLFSLAKQVWVYSIIGLLIGIIVKCAFPDIDVQISKLSLLHTFTPIISGDYWFITSYFLLMLCVPFLNGVINNIDIDRFQKILFAGIIIFSIVPSFLPWCDTNIFNNGGASPVWFCILYLSGAYIRKSGIKVKTSFLSSALIVIITIIFSSKLIIQICCSEILHKSVGGGIFYHHNSIFVYLGACCLFKIFEQGRFAVGTCVSKIIEYASPAVFSVYLIHDNIFIKQIIWTFVKLNIGDNVVSFMATFLPTIVIIFVLGVCTDLLMNKLLTTIKRRKI